MQGVVFNIVTALQYYKSDEPFIVKIPNMGMIVNKCFLRGKSKISGGCFSKLL